VILLVSFYTTIDAKLATLGHFSEASAATGPLMSVPLTSPSHYKNLQLQQLLIVHVWFCVFVPLLFLIFAPVLSAHTTRAPMGIALVT